VAVKIGLIGSGGIARRHVSALEKIDDAELVAFVDRDEDRAVEAAARFPGAGAYTDLGKMLDERQIDAAHVCVPPNAHGDIEMALIERGIPFFVEKPVGVDREVPRRILQAVRDKGLLTSVGYMARYRENVARAREHLAEDEPVIARGTWIGAMPGVFWWRRKSMSGGQIVEQTTHIFDIARYLLGEVSSVYCVGRSGLITDVEGYDVEDASICTLTFESGLICEISSSCATNCGTGVTMEVVCRNSRVKLERWDLEIIKPDRRHEFRATDDVFLIENQVWVDAVRTGDGSKIKSPYEDACKTQMVTCAADESMASGKPQVP